MKSSLSCSAIIRCLKFTLLPALLVSFGVTASAQTRSQGTIYMDGTFFPAYVLRNDTGTFTDSQVATESGLGYDFRTTLGYVLWNRLVVGLTYNTYSLTTSRGSTANEEGLEEKTQKSEWGPTLIYLAGAAKFGLTYFTTGTKKTDKKYVDNTGATTGDQTIENTGMKGFQFSFGYSFPIRGIEIGPTLVYRSVTYDKQSKVNRLNDSENYSDKALTSAHVDGGLNAMISLSYRF